MSSEQNTRKLSAYRINVTGRVQGVGFRYTTQQKASRLGLTGWVRNEADGSVYIFCEGSLSLVEEFVEWLEAGGPSHARIATVNKFSTRVQGTFNRFSVEY